MANESDQSGEGFDLQTVRRLLKLMKQYDLSEVDLRSGIHQIRLRRRGRPTGAVAVPGAAVGQNLGLIGANQPPAQAPETQPAAQKEGNYVEIKSPMLGTFYRASAPDADPYVDVGSVVEPDTVVCIIEAMKVFNEIPAETRGRIVEVLVENGQPVEYGQPLFRVDPAA